MRMDGTANSRAIGPSRRPKLLPDRQRWKFSIDFVATSSDWVTSSDATVAEMPLAPLSPPKLPIETVADRGAAPREDERRVNLLVSCGLALLVGIMTGCGAVALRWLIGFFHNAFYNGTFSIWYNANISEGPSRFGDWVVLSPVLGGLIVVFLVQRFAPEAKGHGVPEVMDAVFYQRGNIRGQVAI